MTKEYKGAVFFDVDGTLVSESTDQMPTEKTLLALDLLQKNGYMVGVATGRALCYIPELNIDFDCYVSSNGACVDVNGERIWNHCFSFAEVEEITSAMDSIGIGYSLEGPDKCFYNKEAEEEFKLLMEEFGLRKDCFYPLESLADVECNKMNIIYKTPDRFEKFMRVYEDKYSITQHRHGASADVNILGMNKSVGVLKVVEHFNIPIENVYAFGDGRNDLEMLSAVGQGVAMGDHALCLDEVPGIKIADTVKNDGIYKALKELSLIV